MNYLFGRFIYIPYAYYIHIWRNVITASKLVS